MFKIVMDVDGTLCPIKKSGEKYEDLVPYRDVLSKLKEYKAIGAYIILFTSRNMKTYNGNIGIINTTTAKVLLAWLDKWEIPYDEIIYGKPWPGEDGFYVDDRALRPDEFVSYSKEELEKIIKRSRE
jgi:capsule biosynthesis phosphatase